MALGPRTGSLAMSYRRFITLIVLLSLVHFTWEEAKFINIVLKPRDWQDPTQADGFFCGADMDIDKGRLLAEFNTNFIFHMIDQTHDSTPSYRTAVFDLMSFDKNEQPRYMGDHLTCTLEKKEPGLFTIFLAPATRQCNELTFEDASNDNTGYHPLAVLTSSDLSNVKEWLIAKAKTYKHLYGEKLPKACATGLIMSQETANSRKNELTQVFNFAYNQDRSIEIDIWKMCGTVMETLDSITKSSFFDVNSEMNFKQHQQSVNEANLFTKIVIVRKSSTNQKSLGFVTTDFPPSGAECSPASEEDIVPLFNLVVFNEGEEEREVIVRVKRDEEIEDDECFYVHIKKVSEIQDHKREKRQMPKSMTVKITDVSKLMEVAKHRWNGFQTEAKQLLSKSEAFSSEPFDRSNLKDIRLEKERPTRYVKFGNYPIPKGEDVFKLPAENRIQRVMHLIGYLMLDYGTRTTDHKRVLITIGNFVYEIKLGNLGNLYDNPVACIYDQNDMTEETCDYITQKYKVIHTQQNGLLYSTFQEQINRYLQDENGNYKINIESEKHPQYNANYIHRVYYENTYNALNNLFPSLSFPYIVPDYRNQHRDETFLAFLSEKLAVAILCETVRTVEMLPVTLQLLTLWNHKLSTLHWHSDDPVDGLFSPFLTDIHPMTTRNTFYKNRLQYDTEWGIMKGVGLFPILSSLDDLKKNLPKDKNENERNQIWEEKKEAIITGFQTVDDRARQIQNSYEKNFIKDVFFKYFKGDSEWNSKVNVQKAFGAAL